MQSGIYSITNKVNGCIYIGSASSLATRESVHLHRLKKGTHHNAKLQNSWKKHGEENFVFAVLLYCAKKDLIYYEQRAIDRCMAATEGYNLCPIAGNTLGRKYTPEVLEKYRVAAAKRKGVPLSNDHRANISLGCKGRTQSLEHVERRAAARRGVKQPLNEVLRRAAQMRGVKLTPEHVAKVVASKQAKEAIHFAVFGSKRKALSEETKAKIAATLTGRKQSEETNKKRSLTMIAYRAAKKQGKLTYTSGQPV